MRTIRLKLQDAGKRVSRKIILSGISIALVKGETVAVLGPNGSGKSSLLKVISGLGSLSSGVRTVVHPEGRQLVIGYVPDRFPKLRFTVMEYLIGMGMIRGMTRDSLDDRINKLLKSFHMEEAGELSIRHFSKGMLQKVNIMQAILMEPDVLLLDEPLSGLDAKTQQELTEILLGLKARGASIVLTSHESELVEMLADRIIHLEQGKLVSDRMRSSHDVPGIAVKRVEFSLPESQSSILSEWTGSEEVVDWKRLSGNVYRFDIKASNSDRLLIAVLKAEGTVISVSDASSEMPYRSV